MTEPNAIIGEAPAFLAALEHLSRAAPLDKPVLVVGERGTGKELLAARLHYLSERWEQPLIKVNCAALTESLLETELFGHEAGAFTGAVRSHVGRFELADGGTLVLDELATIPPRMQEKILRVIEYGTFERVGGTDTLQSNVRVVGSTNQDLVKLSESGDFRRDLLDRLAFDVIHIPPLRARTEDILTLAYHFAVNMSAELARPLFAGFTAQAASKLLQYPWPGNVRELKNTIERSVYRQEGGDEPLKEIIFDPFASPYGLEDATEQPAPSPAAMPAASVVQFDPVDSALEFPIQYKELVAEFERSVLEEALQHAEYNQTQTAELLNLSYHQLRSSLKKHDLIGRKKQ